MDDGIREQGARAAVPVELHGDRAPGGPARGSEDMVERQLLQLLLGGTLPGEPASWLRAARQLAAVEGSPLAPGEEPSSQGAAE